ncbi:MAG TPA: hypothetical protein VKU85_07835 [bacterium]|nr:hypothetical protein [bacterium]
MPFVTIRDILGKVERFHDEFGRRLHEAETVASNGEAKMLLNLLGNHQRELAALLATMEKESPETIATLQEWVQFDTRVEDPREFLRSFQVDTAATAADILSAANELDVCLFCLYRGLAVGSSTPRAQRLFARLARMELDHQKERKSNQGYY